MQRYSLYIDHQLVSQLIRLLENIVKKCRQQLDDEYQTYELRSSIYQQFVFQITSIYYSKYALKSQAKQIKEEELKKFYELTAKLQGINANKFEDPLLPEIKVKKGRPSKNKQSQAKLIEWINGKIQTDGQLKFHKKQLDNIYLAYANNDTKKMIPVNTYLRILSRYDMKQVVILARGGKQRSINQLAFKKSFSQSIWKKQQDSQIFKSQFVSQSQLESTSQMDIFGNIQKNQLLDEVLLNENECKLQKKILRSSRYSIPQNLSKKNSKVQKKTQKKMNKFSNIFDFESDHEDNQSQWDNLNSISKEQLDYTDKKAEIYQNSKSFE